MRALVTELDRRAGADPGQVVAIDGAGPHDLATPLAAAGELAEVLAGCTGPRPMPARTPGTPTCICATILRGGRATSGSTRQAAAPGSW